MGDDGCTRVDSSMSLVTVNADPRSTKDKARHVLRLTDSQWSSGDYQCERRLLPSEYLLLGSSPQNTSIKDWIFCHHFSQLIKDIHSERRGNEQRGEGV